jgi:uncharacterized protein (DUF1015 family)
MAEIKPFQGIRYNTAKTDELSDLICPPYDIISADAQDKYYQKSQYNMIRIEFGKEFPDDDDKSNKYIRASRYLTDWLEQNILSKDVKPSIYIYQQQFSINGEKSFTRTGFIALTKLEDLSKGVVLAHENTLSKPKSDRLNLMQSCHANISPVYVLYEDTDKSISKILFDHISNNEPQVDVEGINGISERLWVLSAKDILDNIVRIMGDKKLFIADGHHRYETALNYRKKAIAEDNSHTGDEPYNYTMMLMVDMDDPGLLILPTHRAINGLKDFDKEEFINKAEEEFDVEFHKLSETTSEKRSSEIEKLLDEKGAGAFVLYDASAPQCVTLKLKDFSSMERVFPSKHVSFRNLDVCVLHKLLLERFLGIGEEQLANQQYLTYTHDILEGVNWVESGKCQMVFFMSATSVKQVRDVSLAGEKMPQKSTYFFPKPPTGLVFNKF